jgi:hypothetical protein
MAASQFTPPLEAWVVFDSAFGPKHPIAINAFLVDGVFTKTGDDQAMNTVLRGVGMTMGGDSLLMGNEEALNIRDVVRGKSTVNQNVTVLWYRISVSGATHSEIFLAHPFAEVMMKLAAAKGQAYEQADPETNPCQSACDQSQPDQG